jgi:hypothetical protein
MLAPGGFLALEVSQQWMAMNCEGSTASSQLAGVVLTCSWSSGSGRGVYQCDLLLTEQAQPSKNRLYSKVVACVHNMRRINRAVRHHVHVMTRLVMTLSASPAVEALLKGLQPSLDEQSVSGILTAVTLLADTE